MNYILLSGGSGKRLWPLSNDLRAKQFLKYFHNEDGMEESMLQRVYRQIRKADNEANITIAANILQIESVKELLGESVNISIEPEKKDTFAAIALACLYLKDILHIKMDEPVIVCPCDTYADDSYFKLIKQFEGIVKNNNTNLYLCGIKPTYPSAKYGYIIPETDEVLTKAISFKEKPDEITASNLISQGALWNAGLFAFRLEYLINKINSIFKIDNYHEFLNIYKTLKPISFDYEVVEKENNIMVLKYEGEWKDLGTWNTLTEEIDYSIIGKGIMSDNCINTNIINETDMPVLAMGLKDIIISVTDKGILVTTKKDSSYIKGYVDKID